MLPRHGCGAVLVTQSLAVAFLLSCKIAEHISAIRMRKEGVKHQMRDLELQPMLVKPWVQALSVAETSPTADGTTVRRTNTTT